MNWLTDQDGPLLLPREIREEEEERRSMPFGLSERIEKVKKIIMIVGAIFSTLLLISISMGPLWAYIHYRTNPHLGDFNFKDTTPPIREWRGVKSPVPASLGRGWVNPNLYNPHHVFNPNYIIDYNGCLSRALYNGKPITDSRAHYRIALCKPPNAQASENIEKYAIQIRQFFGNDKYDVKEATRASIINLAEYLSLVSMWEWVEDWVYNEYEQQFLRPVRNETASGRPLDQESTTPVRQPPIQTAADIPPLSGIGHDAIDESDIWRSTHPAPPIDVADPTGQPQQPS